MSTVKKQMGKYGGSRTPRTGEVTNLLLMIQRGDLKSFNDLINLYNYGLEEKYVVEHFLLYLCYLKLQEKDMQKQINMIPMLLKILMYEREQY